MLGLRCCPGFPLVVETGGHSPAGAPASQCSGFSCGSSWALDTGSVVIAHGLVAPQHMDLAGPGIEPLSPALSGGLFTTEPSGKPSSFLLLSKKLAATGNSTQYFIITSKEKKSEIYTYIYVCVYIYIYIYFFFFFFFSSAR